MKYNSKWGVLWKGTLWSGALANQEQDWGQGGNRGQVGRHLQLHSSLVTPFQYPSLDPSCCLSCAWSPVEALAGLLLAPWCGHSHIPAQTVGRGG